MSNKKLLLLVCLLFIAFVLFFNFKNENFAKNHKVFAAPCATPRDVWSGGAFSMPPELLYSVLFEEIAILKQKDEESSKPQTDFKNSFYEQRLGLQAEQFAMLDRATAEYLTKIKPIEHQAREIINQYRAQYPKGELEKPKTSQSLTKFSGRFFARSFEPLPPPPVRLKELQAEKNKIVTDLRDNMKQAFGSSEFMKFDAAVQKNIAHDVIIPYHTTHTPGTLSVSPETGLTMFENQ